MKLKLKLDKASIVDFFSTHAEKVVFGGVVLGALGVVIDVSDSWIARTSRADMRTMRAMNRLSYTTMSPTRILSS